MKKTLLTFALLFFVLFSVSTYSLTNFGYRGVAFDSHGEIMANQTVELTIEIIKTSGVVYKETQANVQTNQFGAYTIEIGAGTPETGTLANVTATKDMKIKSAVSGGGVWVVSTILKVTAAITDFSDSTVSGGQSFIIDDWSTRNLDVTTYRNGDPIPQVTDATAWSNLTTGAWCYYNNDQSNDATYGKLYNWYAVNDPRGLAPTGWHIPTDAEWKTLEMELGMSQAEADGTGLRGTDEGSQLAGNAGLWQDGNLESNANFGTSGFSGLPGGYRNDDGSFNNIGSNANWWSSSEYSTSDAWYRYLSYSSSDVGRFVNYKRDGFSVRCVRD